MIRFAFVRHFSPLLLFAFYFFTALVFTLPLALHLPTHLPIGTETASTVPLFNLWTLLWNSQHLIHGYEGYWNAPIFYPEPGIFALSDPQPLTGIIFALPYFLFSNAVLAYNLVFLVYLSMNGLAGARWAMALADNQDVFGKSDAGKQNPLKQIGGGGALLVGIFAQTLPFVTREWGVLQLVAVFPVFFALAALVGFGKTPSPRTALILSGWVATTFLTSSYYGLFLTLFLPFGGIIFLRREHLRLRAILNLGAGICLAGALLLPILSTQARLTADYSRSESTIQHNSAWGVDYLRLDRQMWGNGIMPWLRTEGGSGQKLYPGTGLLVFAGVGLWLGRRAPCRVLFCLLGALVAMGISFGLNLEISEVHPYAWLRDVLPGFEQLRSPFRMGMFVQVFLVGLAGIGINEILRLSTLRGPKLFSLIGLISVLETVALPARVWDARELANPPEWVDWLAVQPAGAAAMIPFALSGEVQDFEPTALGMMFSIKHGKPLVNGYSGFFPQSYRDLGAVLAEQFPNENSLARLRRAEVSYLIVEREWLTEEREAQLFRLGVKVGFVGEEHVIFLIP